MFFQNAFSLNFAHFEYHYYTQNNKTNQLSEIMEKNIQSAPIIPLLEDEIKDLQMRGLSSELGPVLRSYLVWIRKISSALNNSDKKGLTESMICEFNFLFEHDLIFRLLVTGRLDLLREYFSEDISGLLDDIERELQRDERRVLLQQSMPQTKKHITQENTVNSGLLAASQVGVYEQMHLIHEEMHRVMTNNYLQRNAILEKGSRMQRAILLDSIRELRTHTDPESYLLLVRAEGILSMLDAADRELEAHSAIGCMEPDGSFDLEKLEKRHEVLSKSYDETSKQMDSFFASMSAHAVKTDKKELHSFTHRYEATKVMTGLELSNQENLFKVEYGTLEKHAENVWGGDARGDKFKSAFDARLGHLIENSKKLLKHPDLTDKDKSVLNAALVKLSSLKQELAMVNNYAEAHGKLNATVSEIKLLESIVQNVTGEGVKAFTSDIGALKKAITNPMERTSFIKSPIPPDYFFNASAPPADMPSPPPAYSEPSHGPVVAAGAVSSAFGPVGGASNGFVIKPVQPQAAVEQPSAPPIDMAEYKQIMQSNRSVGNGKLSESDVECFDAILEKIEDIDDTELAPEAITAVKTASNLLRDFKVNGVEESKLEQLCSNLHIVKSSSVVRINQEIEYLSNLIVDNKKSNFNI